MSFSFGAETRDSLSNLAASLGAGKDKAAGDAFFVFDLPRSQIDAMYRGDWLARKVVDIVPFPIAAGDAGTVVAGCRKTFAVCRSKFGNGANFRGFPHIPGSDAVTRYGVQGALDATGGSLYGDR